MLCFINTHRGFIRDHRLIGNKYQKLEYCRDVRDALPFGSREQAEKFMAPLVATLPEERKWWAVLYSSPNLPDKEPQPPMALVVVPEMPAAA